TLTHSVVEFFATSTVDNSKGRRRGVSLALRIASPLEPTHVAVRSPTIWVFRSRSHSPSPSTRPQSNQWKPYIARECRHMALVWRRWPRFAVIRGRSEAADPDVHRQDRDRSGRPCSATRVWTTRSGP